MSKYLLNTSVLALVLGCWAGPAPAMDTMQVFTWGVTVNNPATASPGSAINIDLSPFLAGHTPPYGLANLCLTFQGNSPFTYLHYRLDSTGAEYQFPVIPDSSHETMIFALYDPAYGVPPTGPIVPPNASPAPSMLMPADFKTEMADGKFQAHLWLEGTSWTPSWGQPMVMAGLIFPGPPGSGSFTNPVTLASSSAGLNVAIAGATASQYDHYNFNAGLEIDDAPLKITLAAIASAGLAPSTLYQPQLGDSFDIMDWTSLRGAFDPAQVSVPDLDPGLAWDTSALYTTGTIRVVPEPGTLGLLAASGLLLLRRQSRTRHAGEEEKP